MQPEVTPRERLVATALAALMPVVELLGCWAGAVMINSADLWQRLKND